MVTGTTAGFGLSERTAEFLSGSAVVKGFTILVHHKTGVTNRTTGEQLLWIFGIALIERNIALSFINNLDSIVDNFDVIGFVGDKGTFLDRQIFICVF